MVLQSFTYQCDVKDCDTPPFVHTHLLGGLHGVPLRPQAPDGWVYAGEFGLMCACHGGKFEGLVKKFFTEPGSE